MTIGNTPVDQGLVIPLPTVISPDNTGQTTGNVTPVPLQGHPGSYIDSGGNPTTAAMMGYLYPRPVQKKSAITGSAGKTLTCTFDNPNNQGNSIVVCVGLGEVENGSTITLAVTDAPGGGSSNTYTQAKNASQSTTLEAAIFFATYIKPGANVVTVTIAGASSTTTAISMEVYEVWGPIQLAGVIDQTATGTNAGSTAVATGAISPSVPNTLAFMAIAAGNGVITGGAGWTLDSGSLSPTGGNLIKFGSQSQLLTTIASVTPAATLGTSVAWAACVATFKTIIVPVEGSFNLFQVGGTVIALGQTTMSASLPVVLPSNQSAIPVSESGTWTVQPGNTPNTSAWLTQDVVASSNGAVPYHNITAATTNFTNVKAAAGQMYGCDLSNTSASIIYVKFYDKATTPATTDTPIRTIQVPANSTVLRVFPKGLHFSNGFGWAATGAIANNDNTAIAANCGVDFDLNS
jgi:hypothetical protein